MPMMDAGKVNFFWGKKKEISKRIQNLADSSHKDTLENEINEMEMKKWCWY